MLPHHSSPGRPVSLTQGGSSASTHRPRAASAPVTARCWPASRHAPSTRTALESWSARHACHWGWEWASWPVLRTTKLTVNADTLQDTVIGLERQSGLSPSAMSWTDAASCCKELLLSGNGWHLPTIH
jgi:hypothetical protein